MLPRLLILLAISLTLSAQSIVRDVRALVAERDFVSGERLIQQYREVNGATPEMVLALSWLGRGSLQAGNLEEANRYAAETRELSLKLLESRGLDDETRLPTALGASIEVQGQAMAENGALSEAIFFLNSELERWRDTSMAARIRKNINLLSLEGKPAPPLEMDVYLGPRPQPLSALKGKPLLLYFWAHWCGDCRAQEPIIAQLQQEFGDRGLTVIGPTRLYGYGERGIDVPPHIERQWIDVIRKKHYADIDMTVPISAANFVNYGSSTTPTLVLVDREGIVRLYHPGAMSYRELAPKVAAVVAE